MWLLFLFFQAKKLNVSSEAFQGGMSQLPEKKTQSMKKLVFHTSYVGLN